MEDGSGKQNVFQKRRIFKERVSSIGEKDLIISFVPSFPGPVLLYSMERSIQVWSECYQCQITVKATGPVGCCG